MPEKYPDPTYIIVFTHLDNDSSPSPSNDAPPAQILYFHPAAISNDDQLRLVGLLCGFNQFAKSFQATKDEDLRFVRTEVGVWGVLRDGDVWMAVNWKVAEDVDLRRAVEQLVRESWGEFKFLYPAPPTPDSLKRHFTARMATLARPRLETRIIAKYDFSPNLLAVIKALEKGLHQSQFVSDFVAIYQDVVLHSTLESEHLKFVQRLFNPNLMHSQAQSESKSWFGMATKKSRPQRMGWIKSISGGVEVQGDEGHGVLCFLGFQETVLRVFRYNDLVFIVFTPLNNSTESTRRFSASGAQKIILSMLASIHQHLPYTRHETRILRPAVEQLLTSLPGYEDYHNGYQSWIEVGGRRVGLNKDAFGEISWTGLADQST